MNTKFTGVWNLESFRIKKPDGMSKDWGSEARGQLIYTACGKMSVSIAKHCADPKNPKELLDSLLFYAGSYSVEGGQIDHTVTLATNPDRVGKEMRRYWDLKGDTLVLTTPQEAYGVATLTWRRAT
jgi:hypothetical protein